MTKPHAALLTVAALTFGGLTNAYYPGSGTTVYFKAGTTGGFTVRVFSAVAVAMRPPSQGGEGRRPEQLGSLPSRPAARSH